MVLLRMYNATKTQKMCSPTAGDLQLSVKRKDAWNIYSYQNCPLPGATGYFVEHAGKVFEDMNGRPHDRL
jgi:3-isopropylmalate/(R)-2-methylmalate dehydratase large subunit